MSTVAFYLSTLNKSITLVTAIVYVLSLVMLSIKALNLKEQSPSNRNVTFLVYILTLAMLAFVVFSYGFAAVLFLADWNQPYFQLEDLFANLCWPSPGSPR